MHAKFRVSSFSRSGDTNGSQNLKVGPPPHLWGDQDSRLTQCPVGAKECSPQTASWFVQPFLHNEAELSRMTDWQPDWRTDTAHISNNKLYLMHLMQLKKPQEIWSNSWYFILYLTPTEVSRGLMSHLTHYRSFRGWFLQARWRNHVKAVLNVILIMWTETAEVIFN